MVSECRLNHSVSQSVLSQTANCTAVDYNNGREKRLSVCWKGSTYSAPTERKQFKPSLLGDFTVTITASYNNKKLVRTRIQMSPLAVKRAGVLTCSDSRTAAGTWFMFLLTYVFTHSMAQSPSSEANWFAASQEIPRISRNPKVHYRTHTSPPPVPILSQLDPLHASIYILRNSIKAHDIRLLPHTASQNTVRHFAQRTLVVFLRSLLWWCFLLSSKQNPFRLATVGGIAQARRSLSQGASHLNRSQFVNEMRRYQWTKFLLIFSYEIDRNFLLVLFY